MVCGGRGLFSMYVCIDCVYFHYVAHLILLLLLIRTRNIVAIDDNDHFG